MSVHRLVRLAAVVLAAVLVLPPAPPAAAQSTWVEATPLTTLPGAGDLVDLSGATRSGDGLLWSIDNRQNRIVAWSADSAGWRLVDTWDITSLDGKIIRDPEAITWIEGRWNGSGGARFAVADEATNHLIELRITGRSVERLRVVDMTPWSVPSGGDGIEALTWSFDESTSSRAVLYAGVETRSELLRITLDAGSSTPRSVQRFDLPISEISGLSDDPTSDAIYIVDHGGRAVWSTTTSGAAPERLFGTGSMRQPEGIHYDPPTGTLHVIGEGAQEYQTWRRADELAPDPTPAPTPQPEPPSDGSVTSATVQIRSGADDVEQRADGSMYMDSSDLELTWDGSSQLVGLRFTDVPVPADATIVSASLEFEVDEANFVETAVRIRAQANSNAVPFEGSANNVGNRPLTGARVDWRPAAWDATNARHRSPDLAAVAQEVVDRSGWSAGNAMVFVISGYGVRTAESFEGEPAAAARLRVSWTNGTEAPPSDGGATTTVSARIASGADDVEVRADGSHNPASRDLDLTTASTPVGLRFRVCVPRGADIVDARLTFTADEPDTATTSAIVRAERSDDADPFAQRRIANRSLTATQVRWDSMASWTTGGSYASPNLATVIAEVTDRSGWSGCGHVVLVVVGSGDREAVAYETDPNKAPQLVITYR